MTPEDPPQTPEEVVAAIRKEQQRLMELQQAVLQGKMAPQVYMMEQQQAVARIHALEAKLAGR